MARHAAKSQNSLFDQEDRGNAARLRRYPLLNGGTSNDAISRKENVGKEDTLNSRDRSDLHEILSPLDPAPLVRTTA